MDESARAKALEIAKAAQSRLASGAPSSAPAPAPAPAQRVRRFEDLPRHKEIETLRGFATLAGLESPFFRRHDGRSGAEAVMDGRRVINFASYDYLGLNGHPEVAEAAKAAIDEFGVSPSASRPTAGERAIHAELEAGLAEFYGVDAALTFVSGHATNVSTIATLVGRHDLVLTDELSHNSIVFGAEASGATRRVFPHNDLDALDRMLAQSRGRFENALIVVEGVYSMDGDFPDLPGLVTLKEKHGCWLMVDEAHALGVLGASGRGLAEHFGIDPRQVDVWMGTLGKTLASCGGYIAGSAALIDILRYFSPGFVYSVALPPAIGAAANAALHVMRSEPERIARVQQVGAGLLARFHAAGIETGYSRGAAVVPAMIGDSAAAVRLSDQLLNDGVNAFPIFHPAVPEAGARIRFFVTSEHSDDQLDRATAALQAAMAQGSRAAG